MELNNTITFIMYLLLLLSSLLNITTFTVYTVTPDDHYYPNTTCHHCHNLQHYLLNITKYFTSNTQQLFLPGIHHLHTDLIIQNVHNFSLIGSTPTPNIIIQSNVSSVVMLNVSRLTIKNIIIEIRYSHLPSDDQQTPNWVPLIIKDCSFVLLNKIKMIYQQDNYDSELALLAINIMGNSYFDHVIFYNGSNCMITTMKFDVLQNYYKVTLKIINIIVQGNTYEGYYSSFIYAEELGTSEVLIINSKFTSKFYKYQLFYFASTYNGSVCFINCHFENNKHLTNRHVYLGRNKDVYFINDVLIKIDEIMNADFNNCNFYASTGDETLGAYGQTAVIFRNTNYTTIIGDESPYPNVNGYISLVHATLKFEDSVNFYGITGFTSIFYLYGNSTIIISGTLKFLHNDVHALTRLSQKNIRYIIIKENSIVNIDHNKVVLIFEDILRTAKYTYPYCFFQYSINSTSTLRDENLKIKFSNNQCTWKSCYKDLPIINCHWLISSFFAYNNIIPLEVNGYYMQFINNSGIYKLSQIIEQSSLCVCTDESHYNCHINDLGYLYPGQTLTISLYQRNADTANWVVVKTDVTQQYVTPCIVLDISENLQIIEENYTKLHYTIGFSTDNWYELFLKLASDSDDYLNIFSIRQLTCPIGFVKTDRRCHCDPVLVQYGITNCNINDQTILRAVNTWISATTHNNSYTYQISLHCPFRYCLPHSSHLNLSTPNSQCQFNRSGLLCGECQQGLSAVFSSPHCQHCSNIYLLLIIPIAIAGFVLVLLLFVLNLTVGFILYVNIISINTPVFFTELNYFTTTYTFISLAHLDFGIQTCFYNGMDDYAKMWLQLSFPFYIIFIATLIIITSRSSAMIQRLTARRALPVLATLFLLSYTKILRIVSSVLFFYSTITHLPSKHTTLSLVWSVDANVPLFGVRFTILFIVCLILFLILISFNIILLFTRTLSRFNFINKFKPLLDAYQGPYKDKLYYWTGLQLVIRAVFFGVSSLDTNKNLTISIILFGIIGILQGSIHPL